MHRSRLIAGAAAAVAVLVGPLAAYSSPAQAATTGGAAASSTGITFTFPTAPTITFPTFPAPPTFPTFPPVVPTPPPIDTGTSGTTSIVTELAPGGENNDGSFDGNEFDYHLTALLV